ncbi:MAG: DUF4199 domain-containing protein [Chitinophagales bacterium]
MIQSAIRYGLYAGIIGVILFLISLVGIKDMSFGSREIFGYIAMIVCLFPIYFGVKHIRDKHLGGVISFKTGLYYGSIIAAIAGILVGILDVIYVTVLNPDFAQEYLDYLVEKAKNSGKPQEDIDKMIARSTAQMENASPFFYFLFTFGMIVLIGVLESLIFSAMLKRKSSGKAT